MDFKIFYEFSGYYLLKLSFYSSILGLNISEMSGIGHMSYFSVPLTGLLAWEARAEVCSSCFWADYK